MVKLPAQIDELGVFNSLFPKPFLDNINDADADLEMDRTWKDFHLDSVGVSWERPSPTPIQEK